MSSGDNSEKGIQQVVAKTKVFLSYSRKDSAFADKLLAALSERGLEPYLDKQDIAPGEPWQGRLGSLIAAADSIVLIVSPESIKSPVVTWEVNEAERLNKRILPAVYRQVPDQDVPERLRRLNYIFFTEQESFAAAIDQLVRATLIDIGWVREHTRLLDLALHWEALGKPETNLLAGGDIERAEQWLMLAPLTMPSPSGLVRIFISQSREYRETTLAEKACSLAASAEEANSAGDHTLATLLALEALAAAEGSGRQAPSSAAQRTLHAAYQRNHELNIVFAEETADETALSTLTAAFAPDGRTGLAYRWGAPGVVLWDGESGCQIAAFHEPEDALEDAQFSPDGSRLLTVSGYKAHLWDVATRRATGSLSDFPPIKKAAFSPCGRTIAAACFSSLRIFDAGTRREHLTIEASQSQITDFVFSPDGSEIWTRLTRDHFHSGISETPVVIAWNAASGKQLLRFTGDAQDHDKLPVFTSKGPRVLARSDNGRCSIWDPYSGKCLGILSQNAHGHNLARCAISSDGATLALASGTGMVLLWNMISGKQSLTLSGADQYPAVIRFNKSGNKVVAASNNGTAQIWTAGARGFFERKERAPALVLKGHLGPVTDVDFSRDGQQIVTASSDATARLWSAATGEALAVCTGHLGTISHTSLSPSAARILTISTDGTARLWRAQANECVSRLAGRGERFRTADFSSKSDKAVTTGEGWLAIWNTTSGALESKFDVSRLAFPVTGRQFELSAADRQMLLFSKALTAKNKGTTPEVVGAALSPDGGFVLTIHNDFSSGLWRASPLAPLRLLCDHLAPASCFAFVSGAPAAAIGGLDGSVCLYQLEDGELLGRLRHGAPVSGLEFSADGARLLVKGQDKSLVLWDVTSGQEITSLDAAAGLLASELALDGSYLAVSQQGPNLVLHSGSHCIAVPGEEDGVSAVAISPDHHRAALATSSGAVRLLDTTSGQTVAQLEGSDLRPLVFFCGHTGILAIAGWRSVGFFDTAGQELMRLTVRGAVSHVCMNEAETVVLLSFEDGEHELWTFTEGQHIASFHARPPKGGTSAAIFGASDTWILGTSQDACQVWRCFPSQTALAEVSLENVSRALTPAERQRFLLSPEPPQWYIEHQKWPYHFRRR